MFRFGRGAAKAAREAIGRVLGTNRVKVDSAEGVRKLVDARGKDRVVEDYAKKAGIKPQSARDQINKWLGGRRKPSKATLDALGKVESQQARQDKKTATDAMRGQAGGINVTIDGTFRTSRTSWTGQVRAHLIGAAQDKFMTALAAGDTKTAVMIAIEEYGPHFAQSVEEIEEIAEINVT